MTESKSMSVRFFIKLYIAFFVDVFTKIQHYTDIKAVNFVLMLLGIDSAQDFIPPPISAEVRMRQ